MIETVVEDLGKVEPNTSNFVEVDGLRLVHKIWKQGALASRRFLRATALPVGDYVVEGTRVIHRYDPTSVIAELRVHQGKLRARTPQFAKVANAIAKAAGGRITKPAHDEWVDYRIAVPAKKAIDIAALQKRFAGDGAFVLPLSVNGDDDRRFKQEIGVVCANTYVDVLVRWQGMHELALFELIDNACTITAIEHMWSRRSVDLRLDHAPKNAAPIIKALHASISEGEGYQGGAEYKKSLANRQLHLWWDG
jgi:hypothetical protein